MIDLKQSCGFTAIELMVTVAVIAISLTIAIPSMQQTISSNKAASQVNILESNISYARSEAVKRGSIVSICPRDAAGQNCTANWTNGLLIFSDANGNGNIDGADIVLRVTDALSSSMMLSATIAGNPVNFIGFNAVGSSTAANANSVDLTLSRMCPSSSTPTMQSARIVTLSPVGHLSMTQGICP
jgi:type IV fimbrial biogenesis protein FimT